MYVYIYEFKTVKIFKNKNKGNFISRTTLTNTYINPKDSVTFLQAILATMILVY